MLLKNRGRAQGADFQLEAVSNGLRFPPIGYDTEHVFGFDNLLDRHGDGLPRDIINSLEPTFAYLLAPACLIEFDNKIRFPRLEVGWRIIESQVPVLPNANEGRVNYLARDQLADAHTLCQGIRIIAVDEVKRTGSDAINDPVLQVSSETGRVRGGKIHIFVKVKESSQRPVYILLPNKLIEKLELRCSSGGN